MNVQLGAILADVMRGVRNLNMLQVQKNFRIDATSLQFEYYAKKKGVKNNLMFLILNKNSCIR